MTLSERNTFFKIGIVFCAVCAVLTAASSVLAVPVYNEIAENTRRPEFLFQGFSAKFLGSNNYAVNTSMAASVLFSLVSMILIHFFFERTSAPEILYISFFALSFSFEAIRLILPLHFIYGFPPIYLLFSARVLLFARFFGIFSLFAAGVCASGLDVRKTRNVVFSIIIAVMVITIGVPIDVQTWDTSFNMVVGYDSMFRMIEAFAFITTVVSFFIASNVRGSREYKYVAVGVMIAMIGRNILLGTDNWAGPVPGILLLSAGTWFLSSKLHKIHLWL